MKLFALFGKKDARIAELACGEAKHAIGSLRDSGISQLALFFTASLIAALESFGRHTFCHSKTPEFAGIGEHPDPAIIDRFTQYAAWYFHKRFVQENSRLLLHAAGNNPIALRIHLADFESVRASLFPVRDQCVIDAIAQTEAIAAILDQKHNVGQYRFTEERFQFFVNALGLSNFDFGAGAGAGRKYQADELGIMQDAEIFAMAQALHAFTVTPNLLPVG